MRSFQLIIPKMVYVKLAFEVLHKLHKNQVPRLDVVHRCHLLDFSLSGFEDMGHRKDSRAMLLVPCGMPREPIIAKQQC